MRSGAGETERRELVAEDTRPGEGRRATTDEDGVRRAGVSLDARRDTHNDVVADLLGAVRASASGESG